MQITISVRISNHSHIVEYCVGLSMVLVTKRPLWSIFFFWGLSILHKACQYIYHSVIPSYIIQSFKRRLLDISIQNWHESINSSGHCYNYKIFKENLSCELYLTCLEQKDAINLCKFRTGNHRLPIVTGRHVGTPKEERLCTLCDITEVGDEFHYILKCKYFTAERKKYLNSRYSSLGNE